MTYALRMTYASKNEAPFCTCAAVKAYFFLSDEKAHTFVTARKAFLNSLSQTPVASGYTSTPEVTQGCF